MKLSNIFSMSIAFALALSACSVIDNFDESLMMGDIADVQNSSSTINSSSSSSETSSSSVASSSSSEISSSSEEFSSSSESVSSSSEFRCPKFIEDSRGSVSEVYNVIEVYNKKRDERACWFKENLNYNVNGSHCYGDEDANCVTFGRLYIGNKLEGICPEGTHVSTRDDWGHLLASLDEKCSFDDCPNVGRLLKSVDSWEYDSGASMTTDSFGFSALAGGMYEKDHSSENGEANDFDFAGLRGYWWIVNEDKDPGFIMLANDSDDMSIYEIADYISTIGYSVRCVMNQ